MDEMLRLLEEDDGNANNIVIVPPSVDEMTDKDNEDKETGQIMVQDVSGTLELDSAADKQSEKISDEKNLDNTDPQRSSKSCRRKKRKLCELIPNWRKIE